MSFLQNQRYGVSWILMDMLVVYDWKVVVFWEKAYRRRILQG